MYATPYNYVVENNFYAHTNYNNINADDINEDDADTDDGVDVAIV